MDYVRGSWRVAGIWIQLGAVFVWPCEKQYGPLSSVMTHNRVGTAEFTWYEPLRLRLDQVVFATNGDSGGAFRIADYNSGRKVGSR